MFSIILCSLYFKLCRNLTSSLSITRIASDTGSMLIKDPFEGDFFDSACICRIFEVVVPLESDMRYPWYGIHEVHMPGRVLVCTGVLVERLQCCYVRRYCRNVITLPYMYVLKFSDYYSHL